MTKDSKAGARVFSHLQVRGSIPVFWTQSPTLVFKPPCRICTDRESRQAAFDLHAEKLLQKYGRTTMVNLVDKQGYQERLGLAFRDVLQKSRYAREIEYTWFDYHAQCKGMRTENCAKLVEGLWPTIADFGWTEATAEGGWH